MKTCDLCKRPTTQTFPISFELKDTMICPDCKAQLAKLRSMETGLDSSVKNYAKLYWENISNGKVRNYIDGYFRKNEKAVIDKELAENFMHLKDRLILTSCQTLDGYRIKEYCGMVFGETIFKTSVLKSMSASVSDISTTLFDWGSSEMSGIVSLMDDARDFAMNKMAEKAIRLGCNAIIGISSETSTGSEVMHITLSGTAVKIEKES